MNTLLIRLSGPMQSWEIQSSFDDRDTMLEPSKSGVIGLLCAACGKKRDDIAFIARLAEMKMGVRVDHQGKKLCDFQTAGGGIWSGSRKYGVWKASGGIKEEAVLSKRFYLADADFLVGLESEDYSMLQELHESLAAPVWPLYLGRKSYVPGTPVYIKNGLRNCDLRTALTVDNECEWKPRKEEKNIKRLRLILECSPDEGQPRLDVPVSFDVLRREYRLRYVKTEWVEIEKLPKR